MGGAEWEGNKGGGAGREEEKEVRKNELVNQSVKHTHVHVQC